jgi:hypothetical protein
MILASIAYTLATVMVMKERVISGWINITGLPISIFFLKVGTIEPLEPSILSNLVVLV